MVLISLVDLMLLKNSSIKQERNWTQIMITTSWSRVRGKNAFFCCPKCNEEAKFKRKNIYIWLFGARYIPLFPSKGYVKCGTCCSYFDASIIKNKNQARVATYNHAIVFNVMLKCMVWLSVADGTGAIDKKEVALLHQVFTRLPEKMNKEEVKEAIECAKDDVDSGKLVGVLQDIATALPVNTKKLVLKASLVIAEAEGHIEPKEHKTVVKDIIRILLGNYEGHKIEVYLQGMSKVSKERRDHDLSSIKPVYTL